MLKKPIFTTSAALAVCVCVGSVQASLNMSMAVNGLGAWNDSSVGGVFNQTGISDIGNTWTLDISILSNEDPSMSSEITLVNNTGADALFTITATSSIIPIVGPTFVGGSVGGGFTNLGFVGPATVSAPAGGSLFTGLIDGVSALTLHDDPSSWTAALPFSSAVIPSASSGLPATNPGPIGATTEFSIVLSFNLSDGDSISLTSFFNIVPTPGAAGLLVVAGLFGRRRRRTR